ncbi:MAG: hypothetical protein LUE98_20360 [Tannerellaceae bacterium]|nr:hypothetical protein [Tannerellaceae bacterium]
MKYKQQKKEVTVLLSCIIDVSFTHYQRNKNPDLIFFIASVSIMDGKPLLYRQYETKELYTRLPPDR